HPFADHHRLVETDLEFGDDVPVLMTEKDVVKCRGFAKPSWWAVPVSAKLPNGFIDDLVSRLRPHVPAHGGG
ncbi:MAG TPA: tetraacyldisaccharide 4'-kinase, partial [Oleiagrimonas sp.]|nr:tetraacyldisaccharide 4'-kinase [Oleiagrimonas sp.]